MKDILKIFITGNPVLLTVLLVIIILIFCIIVFLAIVKQGRELKIWGIKIGKKETSAENDDSLDKHESSKYHNVTRNVTSVTLLKWKDRTNADKPFEERHINYLGKLYPIEVYDESIDFTTITFKAGQDKFCPGTSSSGFVTISPIIPQEISIDESNYHRSKGGNISAEIQTKGYESASYIIRRYNGFQSEEDFLIAQDNIEIDEMILHINFEYVLGKNAFLKLPEAFCQIGPKQTPLAVESHHGKSWVARLVIQNPEEKLVMSWQLCDGMPNCPKYVFGYGSLMHPESASKTFPGLSEQSYEFIPTRLRGYRRTWTAIKRNRIKAKTIDEKIPAFLAYMNIEKSQNDSSLGVVIPVSDNDLEALDVREEMYIRLDITKHIEIINGKRWKLPDDARIFTYISFSSIPQCQFESEIAIRNDYIRLIEDASRRIDEKLGDLKLFQNDFLRINKVVKSWPKIDVDEEFDEGRYNFSAEPGI